ncbi:MAG: 2OG-Fe(II) oxygenase [Hyphomicrobiaceae bacterium]
MELSDVVDTDRYPFSEAESPKRAALVARLSSELAAQQYCSLPGFIRPEARARAVAEAEAALPEANHNNAQRNCYLHRQPDPALPADHPRNIMLRSSVQMVAYDQLPAGSPMRTLYHAGVFRRFIADVVGEPVLYDSADPYQPVNLLCYRTGDQSAWHFDSDNAFTMTLMLQAPEAGGAFRMAPNTRSDTDQQYDHVRDVLQGRRPAEVVEVAREEGALCLFRGSNSLHSVSPVIGPRMRVMAVFVYERQPGVVGDPKVNATIYGPRVAAKL